MTLKVLALLVILVSSADLACVGIESRNNIRPTRRVNQTHPESKYLPPSGYLKRSPVEDFPAFPGADNSDSDRTADESEDHRFGEDDYKEEYVASDEAENVDLPKMMAPPPLVNKPEAEKNDHITKPAEQHHPTTVMPKRSELPPTTIPPKQPKPDAPEFSGGEDIRKQVLPPEDYKASDEDGQLQGLPDLPPPETKPEEVRDDDSDGEIIQTKKKNKIESTAISPENDPGFGYPPFPGGFPGADFDPPKSVVPPKDSDRSEEDYKTSDEIEQFQNLPENPSMMTLTPLDNKQTTIKEEDDTDGVIQANKKKNKFEATTVTTTKPVVPPDNLNESKTTDGIDQFQTLPTLPPPDTKPEKAEDDNDTDDIILANKKKHKMEATTMTTMRPTTTTKKPGALPANVNDESIEEYKTSDENDQVQVHLDTPIMAHPENVSDGVPDTDSDDLIQANRKKNKMNTTRMTHEPTTTTETTSTATLLPNTMTTTKLPEIPTTTEQPETSTRTGRLLSTTTIGESTTSNQPTTTTEQPETGTRTGRLLSTTTIGESTTSYQTTTTTEQPTTTTDQSTTTTTLGYGYGDDDTDSDDPIHMNKKKNKMAATMMTELPTTTEQTTTTTTMQYTPDNLHGEHDTDSDECQCIHKNKKKSRLTSELPTSTTTTTTRQPHMRKQPKTKPPRTKPPRWPTPIREHYEPVGNNDIDGIKGHRAGSVEEVVHNAGIPFHFGYGIRDTKGNDYSHASNSNGDVVHGEYHTLMADGRTQIVSYSADWKHGYRARVKYLRPKYRRARRSLEKKVRYLKRLREKIWTYWLKIKKILQKHKKSKKFL